MSPIFRVENVIFEDKEGGNTYHKIALSFGVDDQHTVYMYKEER